MTATAPVDLTGKVALVTGATGGMGRVIVTRLASLGATVVIVSRSQASGDRLRHQVSQQVGADRVEVFTADLASRPDLHRLATDVTARHPTLDLLVNNAGAHYRDRRLDADGVDGDLLAGTSWHTLLVLNVGYVDGDGGAFPRAARLDWDQASTTL